MDKKEVVLRAKISPNVKLDMITYAKGDLIGLDSEDFADFCVALHLQRLALMLPGLIIDVTEEDKLAWFNAKIILGMLTQCGYISELIYPEEG